MFTYVDDVNRRCDTKRDFGEEIRKTQAAIEALTGALPAEQNQFGGFPLPEGYALCDVCDGAHPVEED